MTRLASILLSASALTLSLGTPSALANEAATTETDDVIIVRGQVLYADQINALKSPTPIIDVPQSLSIITSEEIALRGIYSVGQIIDYTPGVNTSQGEGHRDAVVFRGVRSTADFFIDGVRDDVQYYRALYNLEQVEILRGPNALLFGRGGTGGILNRVTKKPAIGQQFTGFQASIDSFGGFALQADTNLDLGSRTAFRLNGMVDSLANHRDFFDGERIGLNPTLRFQASDNTQIDLSYEFIDHERFIDRGIPTGADGRPVEAFQDIVFGDPVLNENRLEAHLFRATIQHQFSDNLKGRVSAFYGLYDKFYQNFYPSSYNQATAPTVVGLDGYVDTTKRENLIFTGDLIGQFETGRFNHTIVTGIEYIDTVNNNDRFNPVWSQSQDDVEFFTVGRPLDLRNGFGVDANGDTTAVAFSDLNDDTEADVRVFSLYLQDEIEVSDQLDIVVGGRIDSFNIEVFDVESGTTLERTDENITPRLGVVYKPMENISLYASYSETFLPRSGEQFAALGGNADRLEPDEFTNLEAGVKWDFTEGLSLTAAIFEIEQSSPQVDDNDASRLVIVDSTINGFEIQLQGQITEDWFITGGYSYLDGEQVNQSGNTGLRLRELPEHMFSVWNSYQVTEDFGLGLGLTYQDESFINNSNTAVLPSYTRVDAAAYYDISDRFRVQLNVENLTDELYFPNAHSTHQASVGAPLNARLTISGSF